MIAVKPFNSKIFIYYFLYLTKNIYIIIVIAPF